MCCCQKQCLISGGPRNKKKAVQIRNNRDLNR